MNDLRATVLRVAADRSRPWLRNSVDEGRDVLLFHRQHLPLQPWAGTEGIRTVWGARKCLSGRVTKQTPRPKRWGRFCRSVFLYPRRFPLRSNFGGAYNVAAVR